MPCTLQEDFALGGRSNAVGHSSEKSCVESTFQFAQLLTKAGLCDVKSAGGRRNRAGVGNSCSILQMPN